MPENAPAHTPGPWTFHPIYGLRDGRDNRVPLGDGGSESNANRALIAAAPDMLAACQAAIDFLNDGYPPEEISPIEAALREALEAAIARATGN